MLKKKKILTRKAKEKTPLISEKEREEIKKIKIKIVGIGGGGGNIVSEIAKNIQAKISFLVADTDLKALKNLPKNVEKFCFGERITKGFGTGMDLELGRNSAKSDREKIKKILIDQDLVIFIASLGGGVGSGAGPIFAQIAKKLGILTYGIFTLPFPFEGKRKLEIAKNSLREFKRRLNALSIIPNERIFQIANKNTPLKKALFLLNKTLAFNIQNLIEIIFRPALINIDFADLKTIFEGQGLLAYLNSIEIKDGEEEIGKIIHSPLYLYNIEGTSGVLLNIAGSDNLPLEKISQISKTIYEKVNKNAKIILGISHIKKEEILTTILATGCNFPKELLGTQKKGKFISPQKKKAKIKIIEEKKILNEEIPKKESVERKNGLQLKKEIEREEAKILEKEKIWETPTFLKKKLST